MPTVLPPGVSARDFAAAIQQFQGVVGADWVFTSDEDVDTYRDAYSSQWGEPEEPVPSGAVAPASVEEVQRIVRIANRYKVPLYPISTGKNLAYGGSAPSARGTLVLDLKRMNRILAVDEDRHFALVEPGVSYFDLYRHIQDRGLKLWIDCPDPGWGSFIGNALDHGVGYTTTHFRDHFGAHCGMEVVLPNGELMRTGMGAVPGSDSWQDYRYGVGPYVDGLFAQSNFGIVTKMGFWLMPQPESYQSGVAFVPRYMDLIPLVRAVNRLEDSGLIALPNYGSPAGRGGNTRTGAQMDPDLAALTANGWPTEGQIEDFLKRKGTPAWNVQLQFYGPTATNAANWDYAKASLTAAIPGVTFQDGPKYQLPLTPEQEKSVSKRTFGIPEMSVFALVARNPGSPADPMDGHLDFMAVVPRKGESLMQVPRMVQEVYAGIGERIPVNCFAAGVAWHTRTFLIGQSMSSGRMVGTYRNNPELNKRSRRIVELMIEKSAERGWASYRLSPVFHDRLMKSYGFNDGALLKFHEQIKDAIDPNGILAPGRYGIWPKAQRRSRDA